MPYTINVFTGKLDAVGAGGTGTGILTINGIGADAFNNFDILAGAGITITPGVNAITIASSITQGITTIHGDTGSITGTTVTIFSNNATVNSGATVRFVNSGTTSTFDVSDSLFNTIMGNTAGNLTFSGNHNTGFGFESLASLTTASANTAFGASSLANADAGFDNTGIGNNALVGITSGSRNIGLGFHAGISYGSSESSNIAIGNNGLLGESNVIRIGTQGSGAAQQNLCFIAGISGSIPVGAATPQVVLCDTLGNLTTISSNTTGFVLKSNGPGTTPTFQAGGTGVIATIQGDTGSITGATVKIFADRAIRNAGSTVEFINSGTISTLQVSDANDNTLIGFEVGNNTVSGATNTGLGSLNLGSLTSGSNNIAIGNVLGQSITSGTGNIVIGVTALTASVADSDNYAIGTDALISLNGGSQNIAFGLHALGALATGSFNIAIGDSGVSYAGAESSNILIGNPGTSGDSNILRIGDQGVGDQQVNSTFIAGITGATPIGANVPQVTLTDNTGNLTVVSSGTAGFVLTSNGTGTPTFQISSSSGIATINGDTGSISGATVTLFANTAAQNSGSSVSFNNTGTVSTFNVTDGFNNTLIGQFAGNATLVASNNTGVGKLVFSGLVGGVGNSAYGFAAGNSLTNGARNTLIGISAGQVLTTGTDNTTLGNDSLRSLITGNYNISLGSNSANNYTTSESSNISLNSLGVVGESNTLRIGQSTGTGVQQLNRAFIAGITGAAATTANAPQVTLTDNTNQLTTISSGAAGFVLTSNGIGSTPTFQAAAGGGIGTILGDSGSISGPTVTVFANVSGNNAGATVKFVNSGTISTFGVSDTVRNTFIGKSAGAAGFSGTDNTAVGSFSLGIITSGSENTAIGSSALEHLTNTSLNTAVGFQALFANNGNDNTAIGAISLNNVLTGSANVAIGNQTGAAYLGAESSNILIGSIVTGILGESHVLRIGNQGSGSAQQNLCFIAGISGAAPVSANSPQVTLTDSIGNVTVISSSTAGFVLTSNGSATPTFQAPSAAGFTWLTTSTSVTTMLVQTGYFAISPGGALTFGLPAVSAVGATVRVSLSGATSWQITQGAGQQIRLGSVLTTSGAGGSLASTAQGDSIELVCVTANLSWVAQSVIGNITVV